MSSVPVLNAYTKEQRAVSCIYLQAQRIIVNFPDIYYRLKKKLKKVKDFTVHLICLICVQLVVFEFMCWTMLLAEQQSGAVILCSMMESCCHSEAMRTGKCLYRDQNQN